MKEMDAYLQAGRQAGCPAGQMENFLRVGIVLQPRQLEASAAARMCDRPDGPTQIGYGGARGGGKTHWLLAQIGADDCQRAPGLKCLLLRKVGKANLENFEDHRRRIFGRLPHEFVAFRGVLTFENKSRIVAGHFQNERDIDSYLGLEYDVVAVEEATTLSPRKYRDITTCCRTSRPDWRPRLYSTTNPGGVGHTFYRKTFIEPYERRVEVETRFIPATVDDNRFNNRDYRRILENLTGWQRRAWFHGDWDVAAGQYFSTFQRDVHVIADFDVRRAREWFCALDYGFTHYTVCLLGCTDGDGNTFIVDEHAERLWLPERHVEGIREMLARHRVSAECRVQNAESKTRPLELRDVKRFVAGSDVFGSQSDGTTVAKQYRQLGITLRPATMDRVNGWAEVLRLLGDPQRGVPSRLFIVEKCRRLVESLPLLQHDPSRPEDVLKVDCDEDGNGGDDAADALRYLVASKRKAVGAAVG